ncbi:MAG: Hsp33 family molecular chaperone HslO [Myxococcales bacterium]|nr:Hsp33 family molecular chaperone HslO [Myxococcales bacterium]
MDDLLLRGSTGKTHIELAVFTSTQLVKDAAQAHDLTGTSAIALGRLLTATALVGISGHRPGVTSIQILSQSRIQQIFADVTEHGWLRGYVKNRTLSHPLFLNEDLEGRRTIGPAVIPGQVSVVRMGDKGEYIQSATPLYNGEVDIDVDHFLNQSDQVASVVRCDTFLDRQQGIVAAGGLLIRALPDSRLEDITELREKIDGGLLSQLLRERKSATEIFEKLFPGAKETDPRVVPIWRCRCSKSKVTSTLRMLDVMELADMVAKDQPVEVRCELCNTNHIVSTSELEILMKSKTSAQS